MLTSIAQQHANDMAALDDLDHDLSCNSDAPVQFCKSSKRLQPFGRAAENIISLAGNDGSASAAMAQYNSKSGMFSTMMNPDFLYVGIGMAMNPVSVNITGYKSSPLVTSKASVAQSIPPLPSSTP